MVNIKAHSLGDEPFFIFNIFVMKDLIICGKYPFTSKELKEIGEHKSEIWMLGTDDRKCGDVYFELHNIKIHAHSNVVYSIADEVYQQGLPINNSISALLVYAYLHGYRNIKIFGAPMSLREEYEIQKPALAYVIGYLNAKGMNIKWDVIPCNIDYGKNRK